jgi:hypothetical protein
VSQAPSTPPGPQPPPGAVAGGEPDQHARRRLAAWHGRLGRWLAQAYPSLALGALIELVAVLIAFITGSVVQVRLSEQQDLRQELAALRPILVELNLLHRTAEQLQRTPPSRCAVSFKFPRWEAVGASEAGLLLSPPLFEEIRKTYEVLSLAPVDSEGLGTEQCKTFLANLIATKLIPTAGVVARDIERVRRERDAIRAQVRIGGLVRVLGTAIAITLLLLFLPVAVYVAFGLLARWNHPRPPAAPSEPSSADSG